MSRYPIERFAMPMRMPMRMPTRPWDNSEISSSTNVDFLEVYNDPYMNKKRIRQAGVAANLGEEARDALSEVMHELANGQNRSEREDTRSLIQQFQRSLASSVNRNLDQLAKDKLWPMFWAVFHQDNARAPRYERERSKEFVTGFKADMNLSNEDWKMFCNAGHLYLHQHFDHDFRHIRSGNHPFYVRWPRPIRMNCRDIIQRIQDRAPMLFPWLRELFKDEANHRIDPREFSYTISDFFDVVSHMSQEQSSKILKCKTWIAFRQKLHTMEGRIQRYGRSPAMAAMTDQRLLNELSRATNYTTARDDGQGSTLTVEMLERARDMIMRNNVPSPDMLDAFTYGMAAHLVLPPGMMRERRPDPSTAKPTHVVKYTNIPADWPTEFNAHSCECRLIDTNEKLYIEGTGMEHCIWRLYQNRIKDGKYIAYHVKYAGDPPEHKGWTMGFRLADPKSDHIGWATRELRDEAERKGSKPEWRLDQIRGYKNEIPKHKALDAVAEMLLAVIRKEILIPTYEANK